MLQYTTCARQWIADILFCIPFQTFHGSTLVDKGGPENYTEVCGNLGFCKNGKRLLNFGFFLYLMCIEVGTILANNFLLLENCWKGR